MSEYRGSRYRYHLFTATDAFKDIKSLGNLENGSERTSIEALATVDTFAFINMFDTVLVFADSFHGTGFFARNRNEYDGVVRTALMALPATDTSVVVNLCLSVFSETDGILGAVHIATAGYTTTAEVGHLIVNLYAR